MGENEGRSGKTKARNTDTADSPEISWIWAMFGELREMITYREG